MAIANARHFEYRVRIASRRVKTDVDRVDEVTAVDRRGVDLAELTAQCDVERHLPVVRNAEVSCEVVHRSEGNDAEALSGADDPLEDAVDRAVASGRDDEWRSARDDVLHGRVDRLLVVNDDDVETLLARAGLERGDDARVARSAVRIQNQRSGFHEARFE
jgi:hypothetical protein